MLLAESPNFTLSIISNELLSLTSESLNRVT
jgi:hypothetical protein